MNNSPSDPPKCPRCGASLPADAPEGLCPRCLSALPLGPETVLTGDDPIQSKTEPLSPEDLQPHFPQLEILECLGRGGMGVVYKARQKALNRLVALKLLAPERERDAAFAERFAREAQALAALSHPNIVTVHDFGQAGGFYFLLMEYVDGVNLRQAMNAGKFTPEQALAIVPPVCEALQYAHEHGIVHRDIKPENLLLDKQGRVKIADFGIAKMVQGDAEDTGLAETQPAGTPQYMAPEQKEQRRTDHRADIYSLGVVLYELLTGELPGGKLEPPSSKARGIRIDVRLDEVVLRALETKPELRYATAAEFGAQVETAAGAGTESPVAAAPVNYIRAALAIVVFYATFVPLYIMAGALSFRPAAWFGAALAMLFASIVYALSRRVRDWISRRDAISIDRGRAWLGAGAFVAAVLSLPALGLGGFCLIAMIDEFRAGSGWNPHPDEALMVPLIWLGALILPLSTWMLWSSRPEEKPGPVPRSPWARRVAIAVAIVLLVPALFVALLVLPYLAAQRKRAEAQQENVIQQQTAAVGRRIRFVPQPGRATESNWAIYPYPSLFNPNGWAAMARLSLGGQVRIKLPGSDQPACGIVLLEGDDDRITVDLEDLSDGKISRLTLWRDSPVKISVGGSKYRIAYASVRASNQPTRSTPFAQIVMTPLEARKAPGS